MPNSKRSISLYALHLVPIVLITVIVIGSLVVIGKNENGNDDDKGKSSEKNNENKNKSNSSQDKNSKKKDNSESYKETGSSKKSDDKLTEKLEEAVKTEEEVGNVEVSNDLQQTVQVIEEEQQEVEETVGELEKRPKWQTLLFGTDFKNLGDLRSQLVRNRNTIRKLTKSLDTLESSESQGLVQAQIYNLEANQLEIKEIIEENESQFSILGWVFRFLSAYDSGGGDDDDTG